MTKRQQVDSERAAFLGDWHVPFHDAKAVDLAFSFLGWFRPHTIYLLGDLLDCYAISRFAREPTRLLSLQDELNQGKELLAKLRRVCPKATITYCEGNHEYRLARYLMDHPELSPLECLQIPSLLSLDRFGVQYRPRAETVNWRGLMVEHGVLVRQKSGYTAAGQFERRGVSGVSGHTHRLGLYYVTNERGSHVWAESGCLCQLNPHYLIGRPNWLQGLTVGYAERKGSRFILEQVPILHGQLFYAGQLWK